MRLELRKSAFLKCKSSLVAFAELHHDAFFSAKRVFLRSNTSRMWSCHGKFSECFWSLPHDKNGDVFPNTGGFWRIEKGELGESTSIICVTKWSCKYPADCHKKQLYVKTFALIQGTCFVLSSYWPNKNSCTVFCGSLMMYFQGILA